MFRTLRLALAAVTAIAVPLTPLASLAAEGGGSTYSGGVENFLTGAAPPPGLHLLAYGEYFSADKLKDNNGNDAPVPPDFKVRAAAAVLRGIWVTPYTFLGGSPLAEVIVPLVDLKVTAGGHSDTDHGVGDIFIGGGLAFHHSQSLHSVIALDVIVPTGNYSQTAMANIGRNYVTYEPIWSASLIDPTGFNADFKAVVNFNQKNSATDYKSGDELFVDYSAGWGLGSGWVAGVGGYVRRQFTDDQLHGTDIHGSRARVFAIGPSVAYNNGKGWLITAKWQDESGARNALQGSTFWIKTVVPF
jgi:hypothetical protein